MNNQSNQNHPKGQVIINISHPSQSIEIYQRAHHKATVQMIYIS